MFRFNVCKNSSFPLQWCVSDLKIFTFFNITALFALCELECKTLCFILVITRAVTQISAVHTSLTRSTHAKLCDQTDLAVRRSTRRQSADFFINCKSILIE